jgi:hypothetical protein
MRKLILFLFIVSFISFTSAGTNVDFDESVGEYGKYDIRENFLGIPFIELGKIEEVELINNTKSCSNDCEAIKDFKLYEDSVLIEDVKFEELQYKSRNIVEIDYKLFYSNSTEMVSVNDYEIQCSISYNENNSWGEECSNVLIGSHMEQRYVWVEFNVGDNFIGSSEGLNYKVKLIAKKDPSKIIDWQIKTQGIWTEEWAIWGSSNNNVAYYKLDGTSGVVIDELGINNGTNNGATRGVTGKINDAFYFDGTNDYVDLNGELITEQQEFTVNLWAKPNLSSDSNNNLLISQTADAAGRQRVGIQQLGDVWRAITSQSDNTQIFAISTTTADTSGYQMITITRNSTHINIYINGTKEANATWDGTDISNSNEMWIGSRSPTSSAKYWNGSLDEIGIWNRSLSDLEILNLYNGGSGLPFGEGESNISISLNYPTNGSSVSGNITFNSILNASSTITNITNTTLFVWYDNGTIFTTQSETLNGTNTSSSILVSNLTQGDFLWNQFACGTNVSGIFCNFAENNFTFDWRPFEVLNESFNNQTTEGNLETFLINISTIDNLQLKTANLIYNTTTFSGNFNNLGSGLFEISTSIVIPNVDSDLNNSFFWNLIFEDLSEFNTSSETQEVLNLNIDNCSSNTILLFNFTLFDEETQDFLVGSTENTSIEVDLNLFSQDRTESILNFSDGFEEINPVTICINNITSSSMYSVDLTSRYESKDRVGEFYNLQNFTLESSSLAQNISLFNLLSTDSINFLITFKDETFLPVDDALIEILRSYTSEGVFKTVEIPKTDSQGQAIGHFDTSTVSYSIIVTKFGVVLGTFDNIAVQCDNDLTGDCTINLNVFTTGEEVIEFEEEFGISYTGPTLNRTTNIISATFTSSDGTSRNVTLRTLKFDRFDNNTLCSVNLISASGTLNCELPTGTDNITIISEILVLDSVINTATFTLQPDTDSRFGTDGVILMFILVITAGFMMISSTITLIIGTIFGFIIAIVLSLTNTGSFVGSASAIIWLITSGGIILWKITRRTP